MSELNEAQLTQLYEDWTALGAKRERERIIKLLKSLCNDDPECSANGGCDAYDAEIALIKGEK